MIQIYDPFPGKLFRANIDGKGITVGIEWDSDFLSKKYDLKIRELLKGEDYTIELPSRFNITHPPVSLTLRISSWRKEEGLERIPGYQRYRVVINEKEVGVWYNEDINKFYTPDFEYLCSCYPERVILISIGYDFKKALIYPGNYEEKFKHTSLKISYDDEYLKKLSEAQSIVSSLSHKKI